MYFENGSLKIIAENSAYGIKVEIEKDRDIAFEELLNSFAIIATGLGYNANIINEYLLEPDQVREDELNEATVELELNYEKQLNSLKRTIDSYESLMETLSE